MQPAGSVEREVLAVCSAPLKPTPCRGVLLISTARDTPQKPTLSRGGLLHSAAARGGVGGGSSGDEAAELAGCSAVATTGDAEESFAEGFAAE